MTASAPATVERKSLLIAEDEKVLCESLAELLSEEGYEVLQAENGRVAVEILMKRGVDLVLSDVRMPEMDGLALLDQLHILTPQTPVLLMTAYATVESAVAAMKAGAYDYLLKPVQFDDVLLKVKRALELVDLRQTHRVLTDQAAQDSTFHNLVGHSNSMHKLFDTVRKLSTVKSHVVIVGDSGTGKELFARAIHYNGITRDKPFVAVNCGAIPATLIESELFGYVRGAFTGANKDKIGYFEAANRGTIFLDEISSLPVGMQSSLLRVIEEKAVVRVGDTRPRSVDVRVIAASNQNLEKLVSEGKFREDLLFRLNVVQIHLPPLRERKDDIPLLVQHFVDKYTHLLNKQVLGLTNGTMRALLNHSWRGNVRELENVIERAVIFAEGRQITLEDLPFTVEGINDDTGEDLHEALEQFERQHILYSLRRHNYDKVETAQHLGIGVSSLYRKLDELKISKNPDENPKPDAP